LTFNQKEFVRRKLFSIWCHDKFAILPSASFVSGILLNILQLSVSQLCVILVCAILLLKCHFAGKYSSSCHSVVCHMLNVTLHNDILLRAVLSSFLLLDFP